METANLIILIVSVFIVVCLAIYFGTGMILAFLVSKTKKISKRFFGKYKHINDVEAEYGNYEKITVLNKNDEIFYGKLYRVLGSHKYIVLQQSYFGTQDSIIYAIKIFMANGYNCLTFGSRSSDNNTGKFVSFGFYENYDLQSFVEFLLNNDNEAEIGLFGEGMGASTALMCAGDMEEIKFVISYNGYFSMEQLIASRMSKLKFFIAPFEWFLRHFIHVYIEQLNPDVWARKAKCQIYIINDDSDLVDKDKQNHYIQDINCKYYYVSGGHLNGLRNNTDILQKIMDEINIDIKEPL